MAKIAFITVLIILLGCSSKPERLPPDPAQNEHLYQLAQQALKAHRLVEAAQTLEILFDSDTLHYEAAHSLEHLVALLELLDDALEAPVSEVQVLQVTHLGIEGEIVTGSGGIESLG